MDAKTHWDNVYATKAAEAVSWYQPHLEISLALIEKAANRQASIIDVGGGESTLVDDLILRGYKNITVLDISQTAIDVTRKRLGLAEKQVHWLVGDITEVQLQQHAYDVWHDRAVFHFLTMSKDRTTYIRQAVHAVKPGGHVIIGTFGPEGPAKCSGLEVMRYDVQSLQEEFGRGFPLVESVRELHRTPFGTAQQFVYCCCRID